MNVGSTGPHDCLCIITRGRNSGKTCSSLRSYCKSATHKRMNYGHIERKVISKRVNRSRELANDLSHRQFHKSSHDSLDIKHSLDLRDARSIDTSNKSQQDVNARLERIEQALLRKSKPTITFKQYNQYNQQVIVLTPNDDYVKKLTATFGTLEGAYKYLEQCAHSEINGDLDLFKQIYLTDASVPPFFPTKEGNLKLIKEDGSIIKDIAGQNTIKTYCGNSQHAYLNMVTSKIIKELQTRNNSTSIGLSIKGDKSMLDCTGKCAALSDSTYQQRLLKKMIDTVSNAIECGTVSSEKDSMIVTLAGSNTIQRKLFNLNKSHDLA